MPPNFRVGGVTFNGKAKIYSQPIGVQTKVPVMFRTPFLREDVQTEPTWKNLGHEASLVVRVVFDPTDPDIIFIGTDDGGVSGVAYTGIFHR